MKRRWFMLVAVAAALVSASFLIPGAGPLLLLGLVPFFVAIDRALTWQSAFGRAWLVGFLVNAAVCWWVPASAQRFAGLSVGVSWFALAALSLVEQSSWAVMAALRHVMRRRLGVHPLFWTPAAIVALEVAWPKFFPTTYGGVLHSVPWLAQNADVLGVWGLTGATAAVAEALAALLSPDTVNVRNRQMAAAAVLVLLCAAYGSIRLAQMQRVMARPSGIVKVAVVQPSLNAMAETRQARDKSVKRREILVRTLSLNDQVLERKPSVVVWPETAYPDTYRNPYNVREARDVSDMLGDYVRRRDFVLLTGSRDMASDGRWYNSIHFLARGASSAVYRKSRLMFLAEDAPFAGLSARFDAMLWRFGAAFFAKGDGPKIFELGGTRLGPMICLEGLYPRYVRGIVRSGADVLVNATNDAWFGKTSEPRLHYEMTKFRAIESRRPLVRAATSGYSAIIDVDGSERAKTALFEPTVLVDDVSVYGPLSSPFLAYGDLLLALVALHVVVAPFIAWRRRLRGHEAR